MKNRTDRRGALWFWSGILLFSFGAPFWLISIVITAVEGVLIFSIPVGLSIYCLNRGWKSVSVEWRQEDKDIAGSALGVALIVIGVWGAIISLNAILNAFLIFALIGGPGVLIGHKLKRVRFVLLLGLGVAAWGYAFAALLLFRTINAALLIDSLKTVVPPAVLGTLALAWLGRRKLSPDSNTLSAFLKFAPFTLLVISPFIIGGLHDYNRRWDTSPPQVIELKVVEKWIDYGGEDWTLEVYMLKGETLDGKRWFCCAVSETFYSEHVIGSLYSIRVLSGALGYLWLDERYLWLDETSTR